MSKNGNLNFEDIKEEIKLIHNSNNYYISSIGKLYKKDIHNKFLEIKLTKKCGYMYGCYSDLNKKRITVRMHRMVAKYFIENPENLDIVGHKNNIKHDNRKENLYWTTTSENTKKAFDDGLIKNDCGYNDSQSKPVIVYDENMNIIDKIGSISLCAKKYHVSKSTIARHCNNSIKGKTRCGYYFKFDNNFLNK